ncbi:MAG: hypothetical protein QOJ20_2948 [Mycobacterium sp.]|jgi:hypothetical protein|nr:hypothetical protein [Mycobacterium sp.]MDT5281753.1 hypothetical protein [Mycobacterium sp.]
MYQAKGVASTAALLIAAASVVGAAPAAADGPATSGGTSVPFSSLFRNCDFVRPHWVSATGTGSGSALVGMSGANQVSAQVNLAIAKPNTRYTVRLIQVPRAGDRTCTAGDPGVAVGELFTDGNGTGTATVQGPRLQEATGAWVSIDGPPKPGRVIGEFYTSDVVASLA